MNLCAFSPFRKHDTGGACDGGSGSSNLTRFICEMSGNCKEDSPGLDNGVENQSRLGAASVVPKVVR
jgi:hypothetical protein